MSDKSSSDTVNLTEAQLIELGLALKEAREARGFSAAQVCEEALGYSAGSHVAVTRLERGIIAQPKWAILKKLAEFYGVSLEELLPGQPPPTESGPDEDVDIRSLSTPDKVKLCRKTLGLSVDALAQAVRSHGALVLGSDVLSWEAGDKEPNPTQWSALVRLWPTLEGENVKEVLPTRALSAFEMFRSREAAAATPCA